MPSAAHNSLLELFKAQNGSFLAHWSSQRVQRLILELTVTQKGALFERLNRSTRAYYISKGKYSLIETLGKSSRKKKLIGKIWNSGAPLGRNFNRKLTESEM